MGLQGVQSILIVKVEDFLFKQMGIVTHEPKQDFDWPGPSFPESLPLPGQHRLSVFLPILSMYGPHVGWSSSRVATAHPGFLPANIRADR